MRATERAEIRRWITTWQNAQAPLERQKRAELRRLDTVRSVMELAGAFEHALAHAVPQPHSGLVEQQRRFLLLAR